MANLQRRRRPPQRSVRRRKSATPLRVQPAKTMLVAMAQPTSRPEKWWANDDCTTIGDQLTTSPCGGISPVSLESPCEVTVTQRDVSPAALPRNIRATPETTGSTKTQQNSWWGLRALIGSLLLFAIRRLGIGRAPEACLTWKQHIWFLTNRPVLERASKMSWLCPKLAALGEDGSVWDAFQVFIVVATRGAVYAERHGAVTRDGHLLIVHRLRKVPRSVRARLIPMETTSLLSLFWNRLCGCATEDFEEMIATIPAGRQVVLFQHGLLESSMNWVTSATPASEPFLSRCREAVTSEIAALKRLISKGDLDVSSKERRLSVGEVSASLPLALLLGGDTTRDAAQQHASLAECLKALRPGSPEQDAGIANDEQPEFDIWLSNSRGNFFTTKLEETKLYEPPLGHKPLCLETFRLITQIYDEGWTHFDMAEEDIEAVYRSMRSSLHLQSTFRPICVGFSQGASILLMNAHRKMTQSEAEESPFEKEFATTEPKGLVLLCPPVVLQAQEILPYQNLTWKMTLKHVLRWEWVIAILVNLGLKRMDLLGKFIEPILSLVPAKSMRFADSFVRRALRFHLGRVEGRGHIWSYKMTPNGLTSSENIACFRRCIKGASDYQCGLDTIAAQSLPSLGKLCPVHIFLALDDNIANGANSLQAIRAQCPEARRRVLDKHGRLKWCDPAGDGVADLVVSMIEGHSHLDITWTSGRRQAVHDHILATINYLALKDSPS